MANNQKNSASFTLRMHIKTTLRYCLIPTIMTIIKKTNNKILVRMSKKGNAYKPLVRMYPTPMEISRNIPKILRIDIPYDPAIPPLGIA